MDIGKDEYGKLADKLSPPSKSWKNIPIAAVSGGLICTLGQALSEWYGSLGLGLPDAKNLASVTLIFLSVLLTGLGLYGKIARLCGAGTLVPITGFANSVAAPAIEFSTEGAVLGTCIKMFTIAGPVIVFGVSASVLYGVLYWIGGMV